MLNTSVFLTAKENKADGEQGGITVTNRKSSSWHNRHKEQLHAMENNRVFPKSVISEQPLEPDPAQPQSQSEVPEPLDQKEDV